MAGGAWLTHGAAPVPCLVKREANISPTVPLSLLVPDRYTFSFSVSCPGV